nr:energy transducer TonB [Azospirillum melinis]
MPEPVRPELPIPPPSSFTPEPLSEPAAAVPEPSPDLQHLPPVVPVPEPPVFPPPVQEPAAADSSALPPSPPPAPPRPSTAPSRKPRTPAVAALPKPTTAGTPSPAAATPTAAAGLPLSAPPTPPSTSSSVTADYAATVNGRLERAKTYPRLARMRREEGTVQVRFTLARDGTVTACTVTGGSGHDLLDVEACALVYRASPMPPPPDAGPGGRLDMAVPIRFSLN